MGFLEDYNKGYFGPPVTPGGTVYPGAPGVPSPQPPILPPPAVDIETGKIYDITDPAKPVDITPSPVVNQQNQQMKDLNAEQAAREVKVLDRNLAQQQAMLKERYGHLIKDNKFIGSDNQYQNYMAEYKGYVDNINRYNAAAGVADRKWNEEAEVKQSKSDNRTINSKNIITDPETGKLWDVTDPGDPVEVTYSESAKIAMRTALENEREYKSALDELDAGGYKSGDGYDLVNYFRDGGKVEILRKASFTEDSIKKAKDEAAKPESQESFIDRFVKKNYPGKDYTYESLTSNTDLLKSKSGTPGSVDNFLDKKKQADAEGKRAILREATTAYADKYGKGAVIGTGAARVGEIAFVPVARALRPEVTVGDITAGEWIWTGVILGTAMIPGARAVAAGVRGGKSLGKSVGGVVWSEVKAPITLFTSPVESVKSGIVSVGDIAETAVRPGKLPIEALEIRTSTVRVPLSETRLPGQAAKELRDEVVTNVIRSDGSSAVINDTAVDLTKTALNKTSPAAVHATPDVRPFLNGAEIKVKYKQGTNLPMDDIEQGLFVAPNLHSRFSQASAFGMLPEQGAVKGALIIRDEKILKQLQDTNKIYRGTTEIESKLGVGTKLPKPSQVLITRDMSGDKVTLLVFGKKFSQPEILKMKLIGAGDTIKQIFSPAYRVSKLDRTSKVVDDLVNANKKVSTIKSDLKAAQSAKNIERTKTLRTELENTKTTIRRLEDRINRSYRPGRLNPTAIYTGDRYLTRARNEIRTGDSRRIQDVRRLETAVRGDRVLRTDRSILDRVSRQGTRGIERAAFDENRPDRMPIRGDSTSRVEVASRSTITPDINRPNRMPLSPDRAVRPPVTPITGHDRTPSPQYLQGKTKGDDKRQKESELAPGSLAWEQGRLKAGEVVKYMEPPDYKVKTMVGRYPVGYKDTGDTPVETIQTIGGPVKRDVAAPIGVTTAYIKANSKKIDFVANTDAKTRQTIAEKHGNNLLYFQDGTKDGLEQWVVVANAGRPDQVQYKIYGPDPNYRHKIPSKYHLRSAINTIVRMEEAKRKAAITQQAKGIGDHKDTNISKNNGGFPLRQE